MKKFISILMGAVLSLSALAKVETKLITYPVPESEKARTAYTVTVNGKQIDLYKALSPQFEGGEYYFTYFDFEGEVNVKIKSTKPFTKKWHYTWTPEAIAEANKIIVGEVYPYSIKADVKKNEINFKADKPFKAIVIRHERILPLVIFGNPIEKQSDIPNRNDPNVKFYDAGVHYVGHTTLNDNQTLYVAGGAVLKSTLYVKGKNVKICGRGIISTDNFERSVWHTVLLDNSQNVTMNGVIIKDPISWTLNMRDCDNVVLDNIKICASRMLNDDGIDICNTKNVSITDCFVRAQDDIIAIKGIYGSGKRIGNKLTEDLNDRCNNNPSENIKIRDCIFWTDAANIFRIGYECEALHFANLDVKNLYIPFYSEFRKIRSDWNWSHSVVWLQASREMTIKNMHFDGIHIRSSGQDWPVFTAISQIVPYRGNKLPGYIENCSIKNVVVEGKKGNFKGEVYIDAVNPNYHVKDITVENFTYFGEKLNKNTLKNFVGKNAKNVKILE